VKELPKIRPTELILPVREILWETPTTKTLVFDLRGHEFSFYPGQYVILDVPDPRTGEKLRRAYSIASSPLQRDRIELTVKRIEGGRASVYLTTRVRRGDLLKMRGPYGRFYWTEEISTRVVLLGAGSGVVPLMSILRYIRDKDLGGIHALFIGSFVSYEEIIYRSELEELNRRKGIRTVLTLTRRIPSGWKGYTGRINRELLSRELSTLDGYTCYICGPPAFVEDMREILRELGAESSQIRTEKYR